MEFPGWDGRVLVTDGGLATELEARGNDLRDTLWSARLLLDAPEEIVAAHRSFFSAGADIAITASYQASFDGFATRGITRDEAAQLMRLSVKLATTARDELAASDPARSGASEPVAREPVDARPGRRRWVAASVGPYGAALADGSEYRGRYGKSVAWLRDWHRPRLEVLAGAGADLLALETVPDAEEGAALVEAVAGLGGPAWLSYSIAGDRTRAGQPLTEAFAVASGVEEIVAVGVNCCDPADVPEAVHTAREVTGKPVIAYPNSGEGWDATTRHWTGPATDPTTQATAWLTAGAQIIGGCCRVTPTQIHHLDNLRQAFADPAQRVSPGLGGRLFPVRRRP